LEQTLNGRALLFCLKVELEAEVVVEIEKKEELGRLR